MKTERILWILIIGAVILKFMFNMPGSSVLLILSSGALSVMYFPFGFYFFSDKDLKRQLLPLSIVGGLVLGVAVVGVLFKLMFWPGATVLLFVSFALIPFLVALCIWFNTTNKREDLKLYYKQFLVRAVFWFVLSSFMFALPAAQLLRWQFSDDARYLYLRLMELEHPDEPMRSQNVERYWQDSVITGKYLQKQP